MTPGGKGSIQILLRHQRAVWSWDRLGRLAVTVDMMQYCFAYQICEKEHCAFTYTILMDTVHPLIIRQLWVRKYWICQIYPYSRPLNVVIYNCREVIDESFSKIHWCYLVYHSIKIVEDRLSVPGDWRTWLSGAPRFSFSSTSAATLYYHWWQNGDTDTIIHVRKWSHVPSI